MNKDFDTWNLKKKTIDSQASRPYFHEGEIWWSSLGVNVGYEQDGKHEDFERPILIFKKFNHQIFWGLPVTSGMRVDRFHVSYKHLGSDNSVILSQIRLLDGKRLKRKIRSLTRGELMRIESGFNALLK